MGPTRRVMGQQPGGGQVPQPGANRLQVQPADSAQQILGQRPAGHRQRRQHQLGVPGAAASPNSQQLGQPGWQSGRDAQPTARRPGQRRGYQLLGEERIALSSRVHLVD